MRLRDIAKLLDGKLSGDGDIEIVRVAKIEEAGAGDVTFLANLKYKKFVSTTGASALLVAFDVVLDTMTQRSVPIAIIKVKDPYLSFLRLVDEFHPPAVPLKVEIHPTAVVAQSARIAADVAIGAFVAIGERCTIGPRISLYPGTIIGDDVSIGDESILYANVTVQAGCRIGRRVIIHSGTVIGSDGFGFAPKEDGTYEKIPQRGIVVIEDDAEIGANCTIDRASLGETRIGRGVKLDNLIHVAHNVTIGENTVIAGQTGISGSTKIGKNCQIAGQVGLTGHIQIADRTIIGAQSGVPKSITEPGKTYFGYPAYEIHETLRMQAAARQLPSLLTEIRELRHRIEELEERLKHQSTPEDL
ncbi:MAG: UDP-3-O-(3-hydroxymyristoyl)glucosamine N-acyltransferase [Ignavibacteriae bacterium]|nr:UDP-3-O-(3-hydroxymyristoyl)glucosamine N-acyltransferase [Ignavibacteria bacterium]MBI3365417.1 UDP-3-O-(3-hydroxymyristoyl)glucosamine N-acyltransferase [Ignavibacteriota bacterium]